MRNLPTNQILKPPEYVLQKLECLPLGCLLVPLEPLRQVLIAVLRHNIHVVLGLVHVEELHDVGVADLLHDVDFGLDVL